MAEGCRIALLDVASTCNILLILIHAHVFLNYNLVTFWIAIRMVGSTSVGLIFNDLCQCSTQISMNVGANNASLCVRKDCCGSA